VARIEKVSNVRVRSEPEKKKTKENQYPLLLALKKKVKFKEGKEEIKNVDVSLLRSSKNPNV